MRPVLIAVVLIACGAAEAQTCPARASWPTTTWPSRVEQVKQERSAEIAALEEYAFSLTGRDEERKGIRTDALLIVRSGEVVYERYARGQTENKRHLAWSVTKSVTNALTGIAVHKGVVRLQDSICKHRPLPQPSCAITVQNLLEFASGFDWNEGYEGSGNQESSVLAMLYGQGRRDMATFVAGHPLRDPPGESYAYSSGDTTLLAGVIGAAMEPGHGRDFPWTLLFTPLGMSSATLERDGSGTLVGSSYLHATPRDLARFGYFLLNDGCWNGTRILPEGWLAASTVPSEPFKKKPLYTDADDVQGRQFWLNRPVPEQNVAVPFPDVPQDAFAARGHWGQSITVIPSLDLVIVRMGDDREAGVLDFNELLKRAIAVGAGVTP